MRAAILETLSILKITIQCQTHPHHIGFCFCRWCCHLIIIVVIVVVVFFLLLFHCILVTTANSFRKPWNRIHTCNKCSCIGLVDNTCMFSGRFDGMFVRQQHQTETTQMAVGRLLRGRIQTTFLFSVLAAQYLFLSSILFYYFLQLINRGFFSPLINE